MKLPISKLEYRGYLFKSFYPEGGNISEHHKIYKIYDLKILKIPLFVTEVKISLSDKMVDSSIDPNPKVKYLYIPPNTIKSYNQMLDYVIAKITK